jgi:Lon protease-like protein
MPAFPLGTALLPGMALPLRIFEPRYRAMMQAVMGAEAPEFVVALIERGSEVGGGEVRSDVGCIARVLEATELPDGQWVVLAVGVRRVRVIEWLPDDPYPRAVVERWPEAPAATAIGNDDLAAATARVSEVLALAAQLSGGDVPEVTVDVDADPVLATYRLAAMAPLGAADRYRLLIAPGPVERLQALYSALEDVEAMMKFRLS